MKAILLMLLMAAGTTVYASSDAEYHRYLAWGYACEMMPGACISVPVPKVKYVITPYRGYYDGADTVFINAMLSPGVDRMSTLIHEMVHYIHAQTGALEIPGYPEEICWSEDEAFRLTDLWLDSQGYPELKRGDTWWHPYWHCHPYYDPEFDLWDWVSQRLGYYLLRGVADIYPTIEEASVAAELS